MQVKSATKDQFIDLAKKADAGKYPRRVDVTKLKDILNPNGMNVVALSLVYETP